MKYQFKLSHAGGYLAVRNVDFEPDQKIGTVLYDLFSNEIAKIVVLKKRNALKGVKLTVPFEVTIAVDGKVLIHTDAVKMNGETVFPLRMGKTQKGVERFRHALCEVTFISLMPFLLPTKDKDIRTGTLVSTDNLGAHVKEAMMLTGAAIASAIKTTESKVAEKVGAKKGK